MPIFKLNKTIAASAAIVFSSLALLAWYEPKAIIVHNNSNLNENPAVIENIPAINEQKHIDFFKLPNSEHGIFLTSHSDSLVITVGLRKLFDFYLSSIKDISNEEMFNNIKANLKQQLSDNSLQQALAILDNYYTYKISLVEFDQEYPADTQEKTLANLALLTERNNALLALQDRTLTPTIAEIFFIQRRQLDSHTLAKANILLSDLSEDGKEQALINLNAQQPLEVIQQQKRVAQQAELIAIGSNPDLTKEQKFIYYTEAVGEDAAIRLRDLNQQRALWNSRLDTFRTKQQSLKDSGLAEDDYEESYQRILINLFEPHEQARAEALAKL